MTDMYTPANWSQGYGWGQGYPSMYGTAPAVMPSPSAMPPMAASGITAANGGVPPGAQAQQQLMQAYGPPAVPQQQAQPGLQNRLTPQQMQMLQYFMGGRSNTQAGQQQLLMQLLMQHGMLGQGAAA